MLKFFNKLYAITEMSRSQSDIQMYFDASTVVFAVNFSVDDLEEDRQKVKKALLSLSEELEPLGYSCDGIRSLPRVEKIDFLMKEE